MKRFNLLFMVCFLAFVSLGCTREEFFDDEEQLIIDEQTIVTFLENRSLFDKAIKHEPSGIYYIVDTEGDGTVPTFGQSVVARYNGFLLDGTLFDTTEGVGPFNFVLGRGDVIRGWDIGFALIDKGSSATFLIPSGLAYGNAGFNGIPPNSVLMFEVRLIDIR